MTPTQRGNCLRKLAELLSEKSEPLGKTETIDTGKMQETLAAKYISEFFQFFAGCADKISGETLPIDKPDLLVLTEREPLGVIAAIVPWNSQLFLVETWSSSCCWKYSCFKSFRAASAAMLEFGD